MTGVLAAASGDAPIAFIEIGAVALVLSVLARLASKLGVTAVPFYLLAGLAVGDGGLASLRVSEEFISLAAEIGVLLLLLTLGLEYSAEELRAGLRSGQAAGLLDAVVNFTPGFAAGLLLGWSTTTAILLGGVCWISSSGVVAKVLTDLDRLGNRETPSVLNLLVIEDLAMAVYLPVVAALIAGRDLVPTLTTVAIALVAVSAILLLALGWGGHLSRLLAPASDESLLLAVFGMTLLVGGLAQQLQVSAAIGAFLVGLALGGSVQERAGSLVGPLRDLFAATFFLFFSFQISPGALLDVAVPAVALAVVTGAGKIATGWFAAARSGARRPGRVRAGTALVARGEFSIVIAALGAATVDGEELGALAAGYVLLTAILGPLMAKYAEQLPLLNRQRRPRPAPDRMP
jgi:monovalent cation:H+ antiporter-2, CPA2 family